MATYVLIHGAGSDGTYWYLVAPLLRGLGHEVITPDLPSEDDSAGLAEYADAVVAAIPARLVATRPAGARGLILVAQSMGGLTAPLVCERVPVDLMVLVAAMVPAPGESPGEWWANTGQPQARRALDESDGRAPDAEFDPLVTFFHDVAADVTAEVFSRGERVQSGTPFEKPWPLAAWPDVPTEFLLCRDDRLFPADFQRRVVRDRLGIIPDEMDGGHLPALGRPAELVERLEAYRTRHSL